MHAEARATTSAAGRAMDGHELRARLKNAGPT
jgi:hypothetical protein